MLVARGERGCMVMGKLFFTNTNVGDRHAQGGRGSTGPFFLVFLELGTRASSPSAAGGCSSVKSTPD